MPVPRNPAALELERDEMRQLGYRVVDLLVDHLTTLAAEPTTRGASRAEMERLFREPVPEEPADPADVLERVRRDVFGHVMYLNHPRFFGWVPGPTNFVSIMAEAIASTYNPFMGSWLVSAGPAEVELVTIDWLREMLGMPADAGGLFTSGGSAANLTALATARHAALADDASGAVIYCSKETHSSVERALRVLGFAREQLRQLPTDDGFRLVTADLEQAIRRDRAAGRRPFCVVANAGTTNTGAVDPLPELAELCRTQGLWFHVDAAYGGPVMLTDRRALLAGIEAADSVTLDPHKWLFQPYEMGCVLVRDRRRLREAFTIFRDYMRDAVGDEDEVNFRDYGVQLSRNFKALKLWMSLQVFGTKAFARAITHGIELAELAERTLRQRPHWQVVTPAQLGQVTFRYVPPALADAPFEKIDELTEELGRRMYEDGWAVMSSTRVRGRPVFRLCTINPRTTGHDVIETIQRLESFA